MSKEQKAWPRAQHNCHPRPCSAEPVCPGSTGSSPGRHAEGGWEKPGSSRAKRLPPGPPTPQQWAFRSLSYFPVHAAAWMMREPRGTCQPSGTFWVLEPSPVHRLWECPQNWAQAANVPRNRTRPPRTSFQTQMQTPVPPNPLPCPLVYGFVATCAFKTSGP